MVRFRLGRNPGEHKTSTTSARKEEIISSIRGELFNYVLSTSQESRTSPVMNESDQRREKDQSMKKD